MFNHFDQPIEMCSVSFEFERAREKNALQFNPNITTNGGKNNFDEERFQD